MASINKVSHIPKRFNFQGGPTGKMGPYEELQRLVLTCFLWEDSFYKTGNKTAADIRALIPLADRDQMGALVKMAREDMNLRHVPLFLLSEMLRHRKHKKDLANLIAHTIQRPDEAAELISIYWKDGKRPLPRQLKLGLARSVTKFNEYSLAKYQGKGAITLVDVFNLVHPKPKDETQAKLWKQLMNGGLPAPNTWEVRLSAGEDKKQVFTDLLKEKQLGALALLRNLRNMTSVGVDKSLVASALKEANYDKILPFRFIAAASAAPEWESQLEEAMFKSVSSWGKMKGHTTLLIDVSGSMRGDLSGKSDMNRVQAAIALAMMLREMCDDVRIFTFNDEVKLVPSRRGFALRDVINNNVRGGTHMGKAVDFMNRLEDRDRLIVFTDEESEDRVGDADYNNAYIVNVASTGNTVSSEKWVKLAGFSERIVDFIRMIEG